MQMRFHPIVCGPSRTGDGIRLGEALFGFFRSMALRCFDQVGVFVLVDRIYRRLMMRFVLLFLGESALWRSNYVCVFMRLMRF